MHQSHAFVFLFLLSGLLLSSSALLLNPATHPTPQTDIRCVVADCKAPVALTATEGRCTGSAYCTACRNCSRCAYCSSGGTCGVCSSGSGSRYNSGSSSGSGYRSGSSSGSGYNSSTRSRNSGASRYAGAESSETRTRPVEVRTITLPAEAVVSAEELNIRNGPGTQYAIIGKLTAGDAVTVLATAGESWVKIEVEVFEDGEMKTLEGYVFKNYLSFL